ncbi:hypothetical protein [Oryza sativa Japonica Group]|uniref:Uncharacterized protein n=1 Tax=Oryza sativa subsp. japonica TaxID=39947 RepID=Q8S1L9_ORYSJ|nr:hypothetical protein [Oryza sativa Japonica Group]
MDVRCAAGHSTSTGRHEENAELGLVTAIAVLPVTESQPGRRWPKPGWSRHGRAPRAIGRARTCNLGRDHDTANPRAAWRHIVSLHVAAVIHPPFHRHQRRWPAAVQSKSKSKSKR